MRILHHGAATGVTGSCHQLDINHHANTRAFNPDAHMTQTSYLVDCGLFQGAETGGRASAKQLAIDFDLAAIKALIITHCHIDHVGRIPYLLAAEFDQPIYATTATAAMLPMVIEDALKVGVTRDKRLIAGCLAKLDALLVAVDYGKWVTLPIHPVTALPREGEPVVEQVRLKFQPAGHILGSAYVELDLNGRQHKSQRTGQYRHRVVFSGDLGATYAPLLASPKSPYRADTLVIESTYGDRVHQHRRQRSQQLQRVIEKAVADNGVVLIPAFSMGRTQELLYELEHIIAKHQQHPMWGEIDIIVDSPMAAKFTHQYRQFQQLWDKEALNRVKLGRHPLDFSQLTTIDSHRDHLAVVNYLASRNKPAVVIAASGMCAGGRIMNYLQRFLTIDTADVLFVGYQARGTLGRDIQTYGPRGGYVVLDGNRITIRAGVHTISGYSAHADQRNLVNFVKRMRRQPQHIRIVHGDDAAKEALAQQYRALLPDAEIEIGQQAPVKPR